MSGARDWVLQDKTNDRACDEMFHRFGYNLSAVDGGHLLAIPQGHKAYAA